VNDKFMIALIAAVLLSRREEVSNPEKELAIADAFDLVQAAQARIDKAEKDRARLRPWGERR
jgi:hypothetical protein